MQLLLWQLNQFQDQNKCGQKKSLLYFNKYQSVSKWKAVVDCLCEPKIEK